MYIGIKQANYYILTLYRTVLMLCIPSLVIQIYFTFFPPLFLYLFLFN